MKRRGFLKTLLGATTAVAVGLPVSKVKAKAEEPPPPQVYGGALRGGKTARLMGGVGQFIAHHDGDLADVIYNISPIETPFTEHVTAFGKVRVVDHREWQVDD